MYSKLLFPQDHVVPPLIPPEPLQPQRELEPGRIPEPEVPDIPEGPGIVPDPQLPEITPGSPIEVPQLS